jgi:hypothetical protein
MRILLISFSLFFLSTAFGQDYSITDYGATIFNEDNTEAIQNAIDAAHNAGGGKVIVPPGKYYTGTIIIKSNIELNLSIGAELAGITDTLAYPVIHANSFPSVIDAECERSLLFAELADNIKITGSGVINGNGMLPPFVDASSRIRPFGVRLVSCTNVVLEDISLTFSGFWMQHILNCTDVRIENIKIFNHGNSNNDGINIDCSKNVVVTGCWVDSSDDGIAIKSTGEGFTENVLVEDCTLATLSRGVKIGTESVGGFRNVVIRNCDFDASILSNPIVLPGRIGISMSSVDGAEIDGFLYENLTFRGYEQPFLLRLGDRGRRPSVNSPIKGTGTFANVIIKNIIVRADRNMPSIISGVPGYYIENVHLEDVEIDYPGSVQNSTMNPDSVPENIGAKPAEDMFGEDIPAAAFFIRHAKNISMKNVCLTPLFPEARNEVTMVDVLSSELLVTPSNELLKPLAYCINSTATNITGNVKIKPYKVKRSGNQYTIVSSAVALKYTFVDMQGRVLKVVDSEELNYSFNINENQVVIIEANNALFKEVLVKI